jgi:hypothetical protein
MFRTRVLVAMNLAPVLVMLVIVVVIRVLVLVGVLRTVEMLVNVHVGRVRSRILFDAHPTPC